MGECERGRGVSGARDLELALVSASLTPSILLHLHFVQLGHVDVPRSQREQSNLRQVERRYAGYA